MDIIVKSLIGSMAGTLIALKLTDRIGWSWAEVFSPLWVSGLLFSLTMIMVATNRPATKAASRGGKQ